ncbi:MAG TPA: hypothetical protein VLE69_01080 [Candidatus Saccharimonadales bacterium]|nr:hypothetical protein [Candidatus Saccharimonadales bacterium]
MQPSNQNLEQINYSALVSLSDYKKILKFTFKRWPLYAWLNVALIILILISVAFQVITAIYLIAIPLILSARATTKFKDSRWLQFAADNGWLVGSADETLSLPPSLENLGHSAHFSPVVNAVINGFHCYLYEYNYTVGYGRSSQTFYATIADFLANTALPPFILDAKMKNSTHGHNPSNYKKLDLEGDFNKYFQLYVPKGDEIDALTILTPDVMQTLIANNQTEDVETAGNSSFVIANYDRRDAASLPSLLASFVVLTSQIVEQIHVPETSV